MRTALPAAGGGAKYSYIRMCLPACLPTLAVGAGGGESQGNWQAEELQSGFDVVQGERAQAQLLPAAQVLLLCKRGPCRAGFIGHGN